MTADLLAGETARDWIAGQDDAERRLAALARFRALGLPSRRTEAWKYTHIAGLAAATPYRLAGPVPSPSPPPSDRSSLVVVNGRVQSAGDLPAAIAVDCLHLLPEAMPHTLCHHDQPFAALNAALVAETVVLRIAAGQSLARPIEILWWGQAEDGQDLQFHPRLLVVLEDGAAATLIERHLGRGSYLANSVTDIVLRPHASLCHTVVQDESPAALHLAALGMALDAGSSYEGVVVQLGGRLARREIHARLDGPQASFRLQGATLAAGHQHLDNTVNVHHQAPHSRSRLVFKTVLDDAGHGVFQGKVRVDRAAQKTDAHQLSRALLLSAAAAMDSKPELEIFADDVKCGHGAAFGALDEAMLFYLRSRGLSALAARRLLVGGFLAEIITQIPVPSLRESIGALVDRRLQANAPTEVAA